MSLERFTNKDEILQTNGIVRGIVWNPETIESLVLDVKNVNIEKIPVVEIHIYSHDGNYINTVESSDFVVNDGKIYINYAEAFKTVGIRRGLYEIVINIHNSIIGDSSNRLLQIKEISPDRREILARLVPLTEDETEQYSGIVDDYLDEFINPYASNLSINLGKNQLYNIINQKDWDGEDDLVIRLYQPLNDSINLNDTFWIVQEVSDSYVDNVDVFIPEADDTLTILRGPNFDIDNTYTTVTETEFKSWNDLLDANLSTSQQIIDRYFSGSLSGVNIGIDYSNFENFVFYSSAYERLYNFKQKLELIEYYTTRLQVLNDTIGSDSGSLSNNITITQNRINNIIGSFDNFERWLYFEPTSSLSTHGVSGSVISSDGYCLTPWPKYIGSDGVQYIHHTTSSLGISWFNGFIATASYYDEQNDNSLVKTIPEHIRIDENNDQYELFVNMIGHHFDILYTYVSALSKNYRPEEQPKLGPGKEILSHIAESMGWKLANGNQAEALWKYKLGVNTSGSYQSTGSLFSKSNEDITTEIWRRIVNNLPYLLKTKGTERSIKALMSCYGIPQTLMSIREYGGPNIDAESPAIIEDRYVYALNMDYTGSVKYFVAPTTTRYNVYNTNWSTPYPNISSAMMPPIARELRFKPKLKRNMMLMSTIGSIDGTKDRIGAVIMLQYTGSYSGSSDYGRIVYVHSNILTAQSVVTHSEWLPLFDGDFWNLRWYVTNPSFNTTTGLGYTTSSAFASASYNVQVQKASDYITGKIIHSSSITLTPDTASTGALRSWAGLGTAGNVFGVAIGNTYNTFTDPYNVLGTLSSSYTDLSFTNEASFSFAGYIQEYREWLEPLTQPAFDEHTLNPTSYVSGLGPTGSYNTLIRHYPLGTDVIGKNHTIYTTVSSSHPANNITNFTSNTTTATTAIVSASAVYDTELGNYESLEERYYIQGISLGGSLPRSQKIRIEDNYLIRRLSPTNTAERSSFDYIPVDSNRLGLFYSHADQINKDIFNHVGDVALDDYVGSPNDEFENTYKDLIHFSKEYWKKYSDRNDINAYIRIFSQFDFSLFKQIKQLLPARVDDAMGLLIEPHALERTKIVLTKRPTIENLHYDAVISQNQVTASAEYIMYSSSIAMNGNSPYTMTGVSLFHSGSKTGYDDSAATGYITVGTGTGSSDYCTELIPLDEIAGVTGSIEMGFQIPVNSGFSWSILSGLSFGDALQRQDDLTGIASFPNGNNDRTNTVCVAYSHQLPNDNIYDLNIHALIGSLGGFDANAIIKIRVVTLDKDNNVGLTLAERTFTRTLITAVTGDDSTFILHNVKIPSYTRIGILFDFTLTNTVLTGGLYFYEVATVFHLKEKCQQPIFITIEDYRRSNVYKRKINHYSGSDNTADLITQNAQHAYSQSIGLFYSQSLEIANYHDDNFAQINNLMFDGCRITGPGVNIPSQIAAIGNTPVVEVYETNPNQLIYTTNPESRGNTGNTEPGNLIVR